MVLMDDKYGASRRGAAAPSTFPASRPWRFCEAERPDPRRAAAGRLPREAGEGYRGTAWVASEEEPVLAAVDLLAFAVRRRVKLSGGRRG